MPPGGIAPMTSSFSAYHGRRAQYDGGGPDSHLDVEPPPQVGLAARAPGPELAAEAGGDEVRAAGPADGDLCVCVFDAVFRMAEL